MGAPSRQTWAPRKVLASAAGSKTKGGLTITLSRESLTNGCGALPTPPGLQRKAPEVGEEDEPTDLDDLLGEFDKLEQAENASVVYEQLILAIGSNRVAYERPRTSDRERATATNQKCSSDGEKRHEKMVTHNRQLDLENF